MFNIIKEDEKQVTVQFVAESGQTVFQPFEVGIKIVLFKV